MVRTRVPDRVDGPLVQVTFQGRDRSDEIERVCIEEAAKLRRHFDGITSCRVLVAVPHRHHRTGNQHHVRIRLAVPKGELVVDREPPERLRHKDLDVALRDAFDRARRLVDEHVHKLRGYVKLHSGSPRGRIARIAPVEGFGFIESDDGREVYFHRHAVRGGGFDALEPGDAVRFHEEPGEEGPQASAVARLGPRRPAG